MPKVFYFQGGCRNEKEPDHSFLLITIPSLTLAVDRLIIQDDGGTTRFKVEDTGATTSIGNDTYNAFQLKVMGHSGGIRHTQVVTDDANSRLTVMASTANDYAPRLIMIGPGDITEHIRGWAIFDYGSSNASLPEAKFSVRHYSGDGSVRPMFNLYGRDAVTFPKDDVVVGIRTDNPNHPLPGLMYFMI